MTPRRSVVTTSSPWRKKWTTRSPQQRWSRQQIGAARLAVVAPLLQKQGLQLVEQQAGNFILPAYPGLIVKDSDWRWPQRDRAGNAIDFCVHTLGMSFHEAMRQSTASSVPPEQRPGRA